VPVGTPGHALSRQLLQGYPVGAELVGGHWELRAGLPVDGEPQAVLVLHHAVDVADDSELAEVQLEPDLDGRFTRDDLVRPQIAAWRVVVDVVSYLLPPHLEALLDVRSQLPPTADHPHL